MKFRLAFVLAAVLIGSTLLAALPAGAVPVERPTEPRCFVPSVEGESLPVLEFENVEAVRSIAIRYDNKWVTTLRAPIAEWTAPRAEMNAPTSYELVLRPGGDRIRCSGVPAIAQLDLGPDNRACSYVDGLDNSIEIWGDFGGVTHVRNQNGWIARLPEGADTFSHAKLTQSQGVLRYRAPKTSRFVDFDCSYEPIVPIRFTNNGEPIARPVDTSLDNANFRADLVGETVLVEDKRTGLTRSYRMSSNNTLVHLSDDGRYLHWFSEGDPEQAEAADLHERRKTTSFATAAPIEPTPAKAVVAKANTVVAENVAVAEVAEVTKVRAQRVVHVSTNGRANGAGFSNTRIHDALLRAKPGTAFEFAPGEHKTIKVSGLRGNPGNPITITAADRNNRPTFIDHSYSGRASIELIEAKHVTISHVNVSESMWGLRIKGSSGIAIDNVVVDDIGQEGIRVLQGSSYVTISNSTIKNTGRRPGHDDDGEPFSLYGEGIYLGTGSDSTDEVHHITIDRNNISRTTAEAIDIKRPVRDVSITNNTIRNIRTATSGAIAIHVEKNYSASKPNIAVNFNTISNISTSSRHRDGVGVVVGSSADVIGNQISNTQHYAVRIDDGGAQGRRMTVNVRDNRFSNSGIRGLSQSNGKAKVNTSNNRS